MRLPAEGLLEARQVPLGRDFLFGLDADEPAEGFVAPQFSQAGFGVGVPQGEGQHDDAPQDVHGIVIASLAPGVAERLQQPGVGEDGEQLAQRGQRGAVFQAVPGEEGFGLGDPHVASP